MSSTTMFSPKWKILLSPIDHSGIGFTPSACSRARVDTYVHTLFHIFSTGFGVDLSKVV